MCGIVGIVSPGRVRNHESLAKATASLAHRGPNGAGIWWSGCGRIGFGHRRLSVIDLSAGGAQPMVAAQSGLAITFNGEIYNYRAVREFLSTKGYRFRSESDTEVLLASYSHWGEACLEHIEGMFAFAIFNPQKGKVFLARDRAGEKPLFYFHDQGTFIFGSELKALIAFPEIERRIDPTGLECFLSMGYVPAERCLVKGVNKLPPAHCLTLDIASMHISIRRYWLPPVALAAPAAGAFDPVGLTNELETALRGAVARQMVADVPIGVLLSGGIDSSIVTAFAAESSDKVRTFTVSFGQSTEHDEAPYADIVARHFGTEHMVLNAGEDSAECLPHLTEFLDEPMIDSSIIPTYLVSRLVRKHCTVVLGGDGGDELFGGYRSYDRLAWASGKLKKIPRPVRRFASMIGPALPIGFPARSWISGMGTDLETSLIQLSIFFNVQERKRLLGGGGAANASPEDIWRSDIPTSKDIVDRATRHDFFRYMPEDILVKIDRASMANSLEMRAPFLDRQVIEFAFGRVPTDLKAVPGARKILLKMLAGRILPSALDLQRKQGFTIPIGLWMKEPQYREIFHSSLFRSDSIFERGYVSRLFDQTRHTDKNAERVFGLFLLENWAQRFGMSL